LRNRIGSGLKKIKVQTPLIPDIEWDFVESNGANESNGGNADLWFVAFDKFVQCMYSSAYL